MSVTRAYLVGSVLNQWPLCHGCPVCGFSSFKPEDFLAHFKKFHTYRDEQWELSEFQHPKNPAQKVFIVHDGPLI